MQLPLEAVYLGTRVYNKTKNFALNNGFDLKTLKAALKDGNQKLIAFIDSVIAAP